MKMSYSELAGKPKTLQSLTGIDPQEFSILLKSFDLAWKKSVSSIVDSPKRQRAYGAGRKSELALIEDKLLFILVYFRLYPTQAVQGYLFGFSQAQANEWVHRLSPLLNQALGYEQCLPEREPSQLEPVLTRCPSLEFMIDGTERGINRPKNRESQKENYRGKKKTHTVKNNIITDMGGKVVFLSDTYEGRKHDKKIADAEEYEFPSGSELWQDTGFQGYKPEGVEIHQPKKKPRGGDLNTEEKAANKLISKIRVKVEHYISGIKRCRIVVDKFRNHLDHYADEIMEIACGLHNFRVSNRQKEGVKFLKAA